MPDIAMCLGGDCEARELCYRYRARPNPLGQAYLSDVPGRDEHCEWFASIEGWPDYALREIEEGETDD